MIASVEAQISQSLESEGGLSSDGNLATLVQEYVGSDLALSQKQISEVQLGLNQVAIAIKDGLQESNVEALPLIEQEGVKPAVATAKDALLTIVDDFDLGDLDVDDELESLLDNLEVIEAITLGSVNI